MNIQHDLLFASASLVCFGKQLICENVLIDTGSAGTVFSADRVIEIGMRTEPDDAVRELRGVGDRKSQRGSWKNNAYGLWSPKLPKPWKPWAKRVFL